MAYDDPYEDEDWYQEDDDSDDPGEEESAHCPECSGPVYEFTDRCPACGYYLTAADQHRLWSSRSRPRWITITAVVILVVLLFGLFEISTFFF